jgi:hypothetical protein
MLSRGLLRVNMGLDLLYQQETYHMSWLTIITAFSYLLSLYMKSKFCLSLLLCLCVSFAWAQTRTVSGRVLSDSTREGLGGVSVTIQGTRTSTATNAEGRYTIAVPASGRTVLFLPRLDIRPSKPP